MNRNLKKGNEKSNCMRVSTHFVHTEMWLKKIFLVNLFFLSFVYVMQYADGCRQTKKSLSMNSNVFLEFLLSWNLLFSPFCCTDVLI